MDRCNCCEVNLANPVCAAGYCASCEAAARAARLCEHEDTSLLIQVGEGRVLRLRALDDLDAEAQDRASVAVGAALMAGEWTASPGDRIMLVHTDDPFTKLRPGDEGTVRACVGSEVLVEWDSGSTLSMLADAGDWIVPSPTRH